MGRVRVVTSVTGISTLYVLLVLKFQVLLFCYEKTNAFSTSLPTSVPYSPLGAKTHPGFCGLNLARKGANPGAEDSTKESFPIRYDPSVVRFRCRIAYDGTSFGGFQIQGGGGGSNPRKTQTKIENSKPPGDASSMSKEQKKQQRINKNNNPRTIQGELEKVLSQRFQRLVKVLGAGRTDGGVHARGQAIHFDLYHNETKTDTTEKAGYDAPTTESYLSFKRDLETTLNRMLPSDIRAWNLGLAAPILFTNPMGYKQTPSGWYNWNAMRSSTSKLYSYRICLGDAMNPSERRHRWQLPWKEVNLRRLERILQNFEGDHDFVCFAAALEQQEKKTGKIVGTVRTIHKIELVREARDHDTDDTDKHHDMGGDASRYNYRIDVYLNGALYKMVRNIVGTAIDASRGWLDEETLMDLLNRPSELNYTRKNNPCKPAPSNGLTLERVFYSNEMEF